MAIIFYNALRYLSFGDFEGVCEDCPGHDLVASGRGQASGISASDCRLKKWTANILFKYTGRINKLLRILQHSSLYEMHKNSMQARSIL